MGADVKGDGDASRPAAGHTAESVSSVPVTAEDRKAARLAILNQPSDYSNNPNRLGNVRWKFGEEPYPDSVGTDGSIGAQHVDGRGPDDKWFNLKIERHQPDPDPNQRHLLHGGPDLRINCEKCGKVLHIAGEMPVREVLETAKYYLNPDRDWSKLDNQTLVVAACPNGHVVQFRGDVAKRLIKRN